MGRVVAEQVGASRAAAGDAELAAAASQIDAERQFSLSCSVRPNPTISTVRHRAGRGAARIAGVARVATGPSEELPGSCGDTGGESEWELLRRIRRIVVRAVAAAYHGLQVEMGIAVRLTTRQWLRIAGTVAFVGMLGFVVTRSLWSRHTRARSAQEGFLAMCRKQQPVETCEQRVAAHHEECFLSTDHPGSKTSAAYIDTQGYEQCVMLGPETWQAQRLATKRARDAEREQLGLPP